MRVTLLVTSSIAAYKSPEIVRELKKRAHSVRVALSPGAREFVTPLTLQTVSGEPVATELFSLEEENRIGHISLADDCDVVLVAPATANIIAKYATGIADDLPTTVLLATRARIVFAPAMNVNMWNNPVTQENVSRLIARGVEFVPPERGELACGWEGVGRLAEPRAIVDYLESSQGPLSGQCIIVTAGPSVEMLDPIRFITNRSSGRMGSALAGEALRQGAEVVFIKGYGVSALTHHPRLTQLDFESTLNLATVLHETLKNQELPTTLLMAAAPGDYRGKEIAAKKLKSDKNADTTLELTPNPDVVQEIGLNREAFPHLVKIVAFCAESEAGDALRRCAERKMQKKGADFIVANSIAESFAKPTTRLLLLSREGTVAETPETITKEEAARWILERVFP